MRYTWAQFRSYLRLARRRQAEERLLAFGATRAATAGGKGATELLQALQADIRDAEAD